MCWERYHFSIKKATHICTAHNLFAYFVSCTTRSVYFDRPILGKTISSYHIRLTLTYSYARNFVLNLALRQLRIPMQFEVIAKCPTTKARVSRMKLAREL